MNEFMSAVIFEKRAGSLDLAGEQKLPHVVEPLSKVWTTGEQASNSCFEQVEVLLPEILTNLDQNVLLVGQAYNSVSYARRFNALKHITGDPKKTKKLLKEKNEIFGGRFESEIPKTTKCIQKIKEVVSTMRNKQQSFRRGHPLGHQWNKGMGENVKMSLSKNQSPYIWKPGQ